MAANSPTSLPAVNMSPSPRIKRTRTVGSISAASMASASAPYIALVSAFFLSGRARLAHQHAVALTEDEQQPGLRRRNPAVLGSRCHPALQPALRDVEQEHQPVLATRAHIADVNLFRMRTIYVAAGNLSRRFWWY